MKGLKLARLNSLLVGLQLTLRIIKSNKKKNKLGFLSLKPNPMLLNHFKKMSSKYSRYVTESKKKTLFHIRYNYKFKITSN